jgi:hypothetical protein
MKQDVKQKKGLILYQVISSYPKNASQDWKIINVNQKINHKL